MANGKKIFGIIASVLLVGTAVGIVASLTDGFKNFEIGSSTSEEENPSETPTTTNDITLDPTTETSGSENRETNTTAPVNNRTFYFIDNPWWNDGYAETDLYYWADGYNPVQWPGVALNTVESIKTGDQGSWIDETSGDEITYDLVRNVYKFSLTIDSVDKFILSRKVNGSTTHQTVDINTSDLGNNNLVILNDVEAPSDSKVVVSYDVYVPGQLEY